MSGNQVSAGQMPAGRQDGIVSAPRALRIERGARTGQPIIISLDSTELGPALGGCRIKPYASWRDGMDDALRLSAAMTAKAALADMPYGGGKAVVALSPGTAAHWARARRGDLLDESARSGQPPLTVARQRLRQRLTQAETSAGPPAGAAGWLRRSAPAARR